MNFASRLWLKSVFLFNPAQLIFNGNFWDVFIKKFEIYTRGSIVDLGCGTGDLLNYISPEKYIGVDKNLAYINSNKKKWKAHNRSFILSDITNFKTPADFDTAFLISAAHHLTDEQINRLCLSLCKSNLKKFIIVDGYPVGVFRGSLAWLDKVLGGGEHFRKQQAIVKIVGKYFKIEESGTFDAQGSFYHYPFVIALNNASRNN